MKNWTCAVLLMGGILLCGAEGEISHMIVSGAIGVAMLVAFAIIANRTEKKGKS